MGVLEKTIIIGGSILVFLVIILGSGFNHRYVVRTTQQSISFYVCEHETPLFQRNEVVGMFKTVEEANEKCDNIRTK